MPRTEIAEGQPDDLIPDGEVVEVQLEEVTERPVPFGSGIRWNWKFRVTEEGPFKGRYIYGDTSDSFVINEECKAYSWAKALTGDDYRGGGVFDTDDLMGLHGRVIAYHRPDRKNASKMWVNVRDVLPPKEHQRTQNEIQPSGVTPF